jgi:hypothetical protein
MAELAERDLEQTKVDRGQTQDLEHTAIQEINYG